MIIRPPRKGRATPGLSFALAIFCASNGSHAALAAEPDSIAWRDNYGSALEEAKAANRLLWIQFTGPWCPNCTRMERDSFPDPMVVQHARDSFVPVKLRSDVYEELALSFNLSALPATIIVAPTREVVAIQQGYLGPAEFAHSYAIRCSDFPVSRLSQAHQVTRHIRRRRPCRRVTPPRPSSGSQWMVTARSASFATVGWSPDLASTPCGTMG